MTNKRGRCTGRCGICSVNIAHKAIGKLHGQRRSHERKDIIRYVYEEFGIIIRIR